MDQNIIIQTLYGPIVINQNDNGVGRVIQEKGYWAKDDISLINTLLTKTKNQKQLTLYDVGANVGSFTLAFSKIFGNRINIKSFEAQPMIFNMLKRTLELNLVTNVNIFNNAVSDEDNINLEVLLPDYNSNNNFGGFEVIQPKLSDNQNLIKSYKSQIKTITIDSFNEKIDFLKIDIEGMEDKALKGAKKTITNCRPLCFIEIFKTDSEWVKQFFKNLNYNAWFKASSQDLIVVPKEYNITINDLQNLF